jgi:hypothetical protein
LTYPSPSSWWWCREKEEGCKPDSEMIIASIFSHVAKDEEIIWYDGPFSMHDCLDDLMESSVRPI